MGSYLCLALGLWNAPLRLLRRSLGVLHTKHPLEENLCLIYAFWTLHIFLTGWFNYGGIKKQSSASAAMFVCLFAVWFRGAAGWQPADLQRTSGSQRTGSPRPRPPGRVHPVPRLRGVAPGVLQWRTQRGGSVLQHHYSGYADAHLLELTCNNLFKGIEQLRLSQKKRIKIKRPYK